MSKNAALIATLSLTLSSVAFADDALQRMESLSEQMTQSMFGAMIDEIAAEGIDTTELKALIPNTEWDQTMRDAGSCVLEQFTAKVGEDGVSAMLDNLETTLPKIKELGIEDTDSMPNLLPPGMSEEQATAISNQCGMTALIQQKMIPAFMSAIMAAMSES